MGWLRRQPRGRHAAGRVGSEAAPDFPVLAEETQEALSGPVLAQATTSPVPPAPEPPAVPGGVNLVFDDGTVVRLPEGDPRGLAFRLVADALVKGG